MVTSVVAHLSVVSMSQSLSQTAGGLALLTRRLPFEVHYDAACCWTGEMHCSPHDAWCSLALTTRIILWFRRRHRHPSER